MKKHKSSIKNFIEMLRDDNVSIEYKNVYLVLLYSMLGTAMFIVSFVMEKLTAESIMFVVSMTVFFILLTYLTVRYECTGIVKYVLSIVLNMFLLPISFYLTRDIFNGTALFFPFGLILTFFMISDISVYFVFFVELVWYGVIILLPLTHYERFEIYRVNCDSSKGIPASFFVAALGPLMVIVYQSIIAGRTTKSLNESRKIIEEARFNKSRFLANMTHEIRTPMNAIVGMNELILREKLDSESRELAESIKDSSNQLLKIINNILEFSKLDSAKMELFPQKYDFSLLMTEIINSVSNEYASENTEFTAKIDPKIPQKLFGDSIRIKQVFMYLLFSSVHVLPHTRIMFEVSGDIDDTTNSVLLSCTIAESGKGLSESEIEAMMSAYTRYDSRQKTDFKDMGLELSICKEILELMGGTLTIKSIENVGMSVQFEFLNYIMEDTPIVRLNAVNDYNILIYTKNSSDEEIWKEILSNFNLYANYVNGPNAFRQAIENKRYTHIFIDDMFYPILKDSIDSAEITDEIYVITEAGSVYSDFGSCKILRKPMTSICVGNALNNAWDAETFKVSQKKEAVKYPEGKILIVDDSIVNLKVLEGMLEIFEINITKCKSGSEALTELEQNEYDMIILDQRMPEMDGIELLHLIRKMDNTNALVPVLCATADFGLEVSKMLLNEGFQDYLAKPIRKFYLERMLRTYMPKELAVNFEIEEESHIQDGEGSKEKEAEADPLKIDFELGKNNVGSDESAFSAVVNSYYKEGLEKINEIREYLNNKDIENYTIVVHAFKSSSAAIGAMGISNLFKELEFAGRAGNIEFLEGHTDHVTVLFSEVLEIVHDYLINNGLLEEDVITPEGEKVEFEAEFADKMIEALSNFNIKESEDEIGRLSRINFGEEINKDIQSIKKCIDTFDYKKAKEILEELKNKL